MYIQVDEPPFDRFGPFWSGPVIFSMTVGVFKEADIHLADTDLCMFIPVLEHQAARSMEQDTLHIASDIGGITNSGLVSLTSTAGGSTANSHWRPT